MVGKVFAGRGDFETAADLSRRTRGGRNNLRFSVLGRIFGVSVKSFLHVVCFQPFKE